MGQGARRPLPPRGESRAGQVMAGPAQLAAHSAGDRRRQRWLYRACALVLPFAAWEIASRTVLNQALVPPPSAVARTAGEMLANGELFWQVAISLRRIFLGFVVGSAAGVLVGGIAARSALVRDAMQPLLALCSAVPPIALIPLVMVWFGIDEPARVF